MFKKKKRETCHVGRILGILGTIPKAEQEPLDGNYMEPHYVSIQG